MDGDNSFIPPDATSLPSSHLSRYMGPLPTRGPNTPPDDLAKICGLAIDYPDDQVEETVRWLKRFIDDLSLPDRGGEDEDRDEYTHLVLLERGLGEASGLTENER